MNTFASAGIAFTILLGGCQQFESVNEACPNSIGGSRGARQEAVDVFLRLACYRRYLGVSPGRMNPAVTEAAQAHADYLSFNVLIEENVDPEFGLYAVPFESLFIEQGGQGFTGRDSFERINNAGYVADYNRLWDLAILAFDESQPREMFIDELMLPPYVRDILLAPGWVAGGFGEASGPLGGIGFFNAVLFDPSGDRALNPIVYPNDGQLNVPTHWAEPFRVQPPWDQFHTTEADGTPSYQLFGFPITVTFGSTDLVAGNNPTQAQITFAELTGPSGTVPLTQAGPGPHEFGTNHSTVILIPLEPLEPFSQYTLRATASWITRTRKELEVTFNTGAANLTDTTLARGGTPRLERMPPQTYIYQSWTVGD